MEDVEDLVGEIVCIYKKIKQGRDYKTYQFKTTTGFKDEVRSTKLNSKVESCFDFNKHTLSGKKYLFYAECSGLQQSDTIILPKSVDDCGFFWLNIFDPSLEDYEHFSHTFEIHETTIADIREKNSPEKIDVYRNYAFICLKMFANKKTREDINFNIIVFDNFIITTHNKKWQGVGNILNFCYVISKVTALEPSWVVFSIIIEFLQDVAFYCDEVEKRHNSFLTKHSVKDLQSNFSYLHNVFVLKQYIKPKVKIVRKFLRTDFPRNPVKKLLRDTLKDFKEIRQLLGECKRSFERNQDMILGLRDIELAEQSHHVNLIMNRISKITFFFLPIQCVAGIWGMNVRVPWQSEDSLTYFWILVLIGPVLCFLYFFLTESGIKTKKRTFGPDSV